MLILCTRLGNTAPDSFQNVSGSTNRQMPAENHRPLREYPRPLDTTCRSESQREADVSGKRKHARTTARTVYYILGSESVPVGDKSVL